MTDKIAQVADLLDEAARSGQPTAPVRQLLPEGDLDSAYAVQRHNTNRALKQGRRLSGRKIGLTSLAVQKQLGVDQPDFGMLFADMAFADGEEIPWARLMQAKCEAEVALVLERDLGDEGLTMAGLIAATAYVLPAIEIVGSRIERWDIKITDTIADNASSGLYVTGNQPVKLADVDLRLCGMVMERRGDPVSYGVGAACLGHPLNAALWLARTLVRVGQPLRAGDLVLTGALGPMVAVQPADVFEARIQGLGSVRAVFGSPQ
jgi:2-keto-4-pentenoate hydratase